jgi:HSP20 family molecular chaperone IbpA
MSPKHRDPLREMEAMLRGWSPTASPRGEHETMTTADWTPAVDIAETADEYLINVELTEVSKEKVGGTRGEHLAPAFGHFEF